MLNFILGFLVGAVAGIAVGAWIERKFGLVERANLEWTVGVLMLRLLSEVVIDIAVSCAVALWYFLAASLRWIANAMLSVLRRFFPWRVLRWLLGTIVLVSWTLAAIFAFLVVPHGQQTVGWEDFISFLTELVRLLIQLLRLLLPIILIVIAIGATRPNKGSGQIREKRSLPYWWLLALGVLVAAGWLVFRSRPTTVFEPFAATSQPAVQAKPIYLPSHDTWVVEAAIRPQSGWGTIRMTQAGGDPHDLLKSRAITIINGRKVVDRGDVIMAPVVGRREIWYLVRNRLTGERIWFIPSRTEN